MFDGLTFGVLDFSYAGFGHFETRLKEDGVFDVNLGDYIQSIAVREALLSIGVREEQIVHVDRDTLASSDGDPVFLVMNGVFYPRCFPLPPHIIPVWFGFSYCASNIHADETDQQYHQALASLRPAYPVGCRDLATMHALQAAGHEAYLSGCLSATLLRPDMDRSGLRGLVCGLDDAPLKDELMRQGDMFFLPDQRWAVREFPLGRSSRSACRRAAAALLDFYWNHVSFVVTSLMHCALPCAAMGIPAVVVRHDPDNYRFDMARALMPVVDASRHQDALALRNMVQAIEVRDLLLPALRDAVGMAVASSMVR